VIALERTLLAEQAELHQLLRDLCEPLNDLAGYIEHNKGFTRITAEINGKDTTISLAMQEKQREIEEVQREHQQYMNVLHATLPRHIADRVAQGERVNDYHEDTAVLFLDIVSFTTHSTQLDASSVVDLLQRVFTTFDAICAHFNVMKVKTIGDAYMAIAHPESRHVSNLASAAHAMITSSFTWPNTNERVQFRIGMHIGPVIAGVLGTERLQYDVWGDTVNVASRMESHGEAGRIHVSEAIANALTPYLPDSITLRQRGVIDVKGKGPMTTYWLEGADVHAGS
jgi:class 3 adenylate cyclase